MRLGFVAAFAALGAGCLLPGHGSPNEGGSGHSNVGSWLPGQGPRYCSVYPRQWTSWQDPVKLPPSCPYEGWVRQVVRDIHDVDGCATGELHVVLCIDKRGVLTSVDVTQPISQDTRQCVYRALRGWELAPAESPGSLLVVY